MAKYAPPEVAGLTEGFAQVVMGLVAGHHDFLRSLYMQLELGRSVGRNYLGVEIDPDTHQVAHRRMRGLAVLLAALLRMVQDEAGEAQDHAPQLQTA